MGKTGTGAGKSEKEEIKKEEPKKKRQFNRIVFKRKDVLWGLIIKGKIAAGKLSPEEQGMDTYGHWWVEVNDKSYGWWPVGQVSFWNTIKGVDGILNWSEEGKTTELDPHHGDDANEEFCMIVSRDDLRTMDDIASIMRSFALSFESGWAYPARWGYDNCHSFQKKIIKKCDFYQKGKSEYKDNKGNVTKTNATPPNVEEVF